MITPARILALAMAVAAVLVLWLGHGVSFSGDEIVFVVGTPHLDLRTVFDPHGGHLLAITRLVYKPMLDVFGLSYLPFRILALLTNLLCVGLLFIWARRRVDPWLALLPCLVLLFFGADPLHTFQGNGFTVMLSVAMGLAALLAIDRRDRIGDFAACGFLILAILSYSVGIPFIFGVGLLLVWNRRWRSLWVALVPLVIFALWKLTAGSSGTGSSVDLPGILLLPSWGFQATGSYLASLSGLGYDFTGTGQAVNSPVGPALAVAALAGFAFSVYRRGIGSTLAAVAVIALVLWAMQAVAAGPAGSLRLPGDPRYQYPGAVVMVLIVFAAVGPVRPGKRTLAILGVATLAAISMNVMMLRDGANQVRSMSQLTQANAGMLKVAGAVTSPDEKPDVSSTVSALSAMAGTPYGDYGYDFEVLRQLPELLRQDLDQKLSKLVSFELKPVKGTGLRCHPGEVATPGPEVVIRSKRGGEVTAGMLADVATLPVGWIAPEQPTRVNLSATGGHDWRLAVSSGDLEICQ